MFLATPSTTTGMTTQTPVITTEATTTLTTTLSPADKFGDLINGIFNGGDITPAKAAFSAQIGSLGGKTEGAAEAFGSLGNVAAVVVPNPTEAQKLIISEKIKEYFDKATAFIESQPGLENFNTNMFLLNDPEFAPFVEYYKRLKDEAKYAEMNPATAYDYFTNVACSYGQFVPFMIETSLAVEAKKATAS